MNLSNLKQKEGQHPADAWNSCSLEFTEVTLSHLRYFVISSFESILREKAMSPEVRLIMNNLMELCAMFWITRHSGDFMRFANLEV